MDFDEGWARAYYESALGSAVLAAGFLIIGCGNQQQADRYLHDNLPGDAQEFMTAFPPEKHFFSNVRRILAGI